MTTEEKKRIEKDAEAFVFNHIHDKFGLDRQECYIAGAIAQHNHMAEQLKQERNKAIDESIAIVNESTHWTACVQKLRSLKH